MLAQLIDPETRFGSLFNARPFLNVMAIKIHDRADRDTYYGIRFFFVAQMA